MPVVGGWRASVAKREYHGEGTRRSLSLSLCIHPSFSFSLPLSRKRDGTRWLARSLAATGRCSKDARSSSSTEQHSRNMTRYVASLVGWEGSGARGGRVAAARGAVEQPGRAKRRALVGVDTVKVSLSSKVAEGCHLKRERLDILSSFSRPFPRFLPSFLYLALSPHPIALSLFSPLHPSRILGLAFGPNRKVRPSTHSVFLFSLSLSLTQCVFHFLPFLSLFTLMCV